MSFLNIKSDTVTINKIVELLEFKTFQLLYAVFQNLEANHEVDKFYFK